MNHAIAGALRVPVVAAPMFLVSGPDLVIATCRAGIIGSFPTQNCRTVADLDTWMGTITDRLSTGGERPPAPWAANLVTHSSNERLKDDLQLIAEYKPQVVITALGSPRPVMEVVKGYGGTVIADVVNMKLAHKAAAAGVDGMACISAGAGGHTGHLSPFAFTSAVREFFDGMIVIGGGITDGHGVAGAITAGADLVYMGTRFLAAQESMAESEYKQMIVDNGPDDLIVSSAITGTPASWLRPSLVACGLDPDNLQSPTGSKNYTAGGASIKRWRDVWAAGQGLQTVRAIEPAGTIVDRIAAEYDTALGRASTAHDALRVPGGTVVA
ncbi:NAD(P)H-dependent flavin oxidoreductase [Gordonia terrae]|uniref:Nitronate monooxygenase n=2 Tax=Gordonia terrae TaxID=2055 RepID=A0AAD0KEY9_9ACTN|nr:nitronate monooxygenase [Gordonia terrae]VTR08073.1 enoyl-(acyl-carrier-protein) reductase II [Clostridioides difficile]ANY25205.1 2-nitropropane dioxygenase [Gordonia terrae]AWO85952.1 nitronate monooxygenase [Gordonia terrae]VTS62172.1 Nitronate monooxygenase [Gordonia terrae]GAB45544.1 putative 2-nitropropane dioxygenase [Gordonia terrae NBRC 100016]